MVTGVCSSCVEYIGSNMVDSVSPVSGVYWGCVEFTDLDPLS